MNSLKQDDIYWSIDVIHDKNTSPKNKKNALLIVLELLQEATQSEIQHGKWQQIIEDVCAPVFIRPERQDLRSISSKIIVLIGTVLFKKSEFEQFHQLISQIFSNILRKYEDSRAELLFIFSHIIGETSSHNSDILCEKHVELILQWILDIIPSANSVVYTNCVKTIIFISTVYTNIFESKFEEIMDILCCEAAKNLDSSKNFDFFLENFENFQGFFKDKPEIAENLASKLISQKDGDIKRRMMIVLILMKISQSRKTMLEINQAISQSSMKSSSNLSAFSPIFQELFIFCKDSEDIEEIEKNIELILAEPQLADEDFIDFLAKIVPHLPVQSPIKNRIIDLVFDENQGFFCTANCDMLLAGRHQLYKQISELISCLLTPKSLAYLQATFSAVRRIVLENIEQLRNATNIPSEISRWHESNLILLLSSLNSISCAKSSLIVMMGIKPSIFEFLIKELPLTEYWLIEKHPAVYHMILHILVQHLKSHEYYLAQSEYVQQGDSVGQTKREYAKIQLKTMEKILRFDAENMPRKIRILIISWISAFVSMAVEMNFGEDVYRKNEEWKELKSTMCFQSGLTWNSEGITSILSKLSTIMPWSENDEDKENRIMEKTKKASWKDAGIIWEAGDSRTYIRQSVNGKYQMSQETQQKHVPTTTFGPDEFTTVTNFLLKSIVPTTFRKGSYNWMDEMLDSMTNLCSIIGEKKKVEISEKFFEKWRWILAQTANFCIINKMKTPLGKPMETFNAFSVEINKLAKQVLTNRKSLNKTNENEPNPPQKLRYTIQWIRVRLLIELIDILDKMMCCAMYGGASFNLNDIPQLSRQFFTTNVQSCAEWLNRTYYSAMVVSFFNGNYALTIRFGWSALLVYQKRPKDEKTIGLAVQICCWMTRSMVFLGDSQSIRGMKNWMKNEFETEMAQNIYDAMELMAQNRYEMALFNFELILRNDQSIGETVKLIIHNCIIDILNRLRNWENIDYYKALLYGEEDSTVSEDFRSVELLTKFEKVEGKEKRHILGWNVRQKSMAIEAAFSQTMRKFEINDIKRDLSQMGALLLNSDTSCRLYSDISSTNMIVSYLVDKMNGFKPKSELTTSDLFENYEYDEGEKLTAVNKIVSWAKHLHTSRGISGDCYAEVVRLARKTDNRNLAIRIMMLSMKFGVSPWMSLENAKQDLKLTKNENLDMRTQKIIGVFATLANVFMVNFKNKQNMKMERAPAEYYGEFLSLNYEDRVDFVRKCDESMARVSLQLSEFFDQYHDHENYLIPHIGQTHLWAEIHQKRIDLGVNYRGFVGALLSISTEMCPELAKTHLKFAQWAYQLADVQYVKEMNTVYQHVMLHADPTINESLWKCLECSTLGQIETEIRKLISNPAEISNLLSPNGYYLNMWANVKEHRTKYLTLSASSYFQFIHASNGSLPYSKKEEITVATLRILDMLVKHGDILIEIIENGLNTTNVHVWKDILPQLFARLSHPSEHIRTTLVNLISRICAVSPHSVVFQVVSGAASHFTNEGDEEGENEEEQQEIQDDDRNKVRDCCEQLENRLSEQYPKLVEDVRKFIGELERINLLFEEKWAVVLGTMEHEMEKRIQLILQETNKTIKAKHLTQNEREEIIRKKTKLMTSQVFEVLDELYEKTCEKGAMTENEKGFQMVFKEVLQKAFLESKMNRMSPEKAWAPFKNLVSTFVHRSLKRGMQTFEIENISHYLATLNDSFVPMPGQDSIDFNNLVTISRVAKQVTILPTKTRPKKLAFIGSDGKSCTFLFKGREDLHLDERVMQFLRLCNIMLKSGKSRKVVEYQANDYAVIPLGPRSGLIKWVEGATPLFHIYRKWQIRDKAHRQAIQKNGETIGEIEKPSEMYHRMIRQAFHSNNIDSSIASDRSKWPSNILLEVYSNLIEKTPSDLLSRELWIQSGDATSWYRKSMRFGRSCSVMSMIGSVLGLGDRHLDNLLVDLQFGNIIHIDYNICFEKGKNLRIPETVPFRLTQNMMNALGPAKIDGVFRQSCYHVLETLRNGKQVLTMLLDAFVYDPLVDWTNHENITTSGISLALKLAVYGNEWKKKTNSSENNSMEMFKLRLTELKFDWENNREDLKSSIQMYSSAVIMRQDTQESSRLMLQAVTKHHSIMKCLRPLIRTISKTNSNFVNYYAIYKKYFNEPLLKAHAAMPNEIDKSICVQKFSIVLENIDRVFNGLLELTNPPKMARILDRNSTTQPPPPGLENVWLVKEDQVENVMARQIVKSVEKRLDGFVNNLNESMTPEKQADYLIAEATNPNNLSKMYEGWTSWV